MSKFVDDYKDAPRILFIGWPNSSHTHSWIELLQGEEFNVRLFGLPTLPPPDWPVKTYLTLYAPNQNPQYRAFANSELRRLWSYFTEKFGQGILKRFHVPQYKLIEVALKKIIDDWKPHVVHTLGFDPASYLYLRATPTLAWKNVRWVAQARGGPDLDLWRFIPDFEHQIKNVIESCDYFIADNTWNYEFAKTQGLEDRQLTEFGRVSGTGGMDLEELGKSTEVPPSKRDRLIYMPKCYDNVAVRGHAALEGLRLAWPHMKKPCRVVLSWITQSDFRPWVKKALGEEILAHCEMHNDILPRSQSLEIMGKARVLYAPSVQDGIPNCMLEAMACGTFPIISPLPSVDDVAENEKNVLYARNLYPEELAQALVRAMNDDDLVDQAASENLKLVTRISDRREIKKTAVNFYNRLAQESEN